MDAAAPSLLAAIATGLVVLVFARALLHKLSDLTGFRATLAEYRLLPQGSDGAAAMALIAAEGLTLATLLLPVARPLGHLAAAGLLVIYGTAMAVNLLRGRTRIDCGCGGSGQALSWTLVGRNAVLTAATLAATAFPVDLDLAQATVAVAAIASFWIMLVLFEQLVGNHTHARLSGQV